MKTIERWVLRISDRDFAWIGLGWMRPAKHQRISLRRILFSSVLLGLPGVLVGIGLLYVLFGQVKPEFCLLLVSVALVIELLLHVVWARYWNRRAEALANERANA